MNKKPNELIQDPIFNKGTGFTEREREKLHLHGLLPFQVETIQVQVEKAYTKFQSRTTPLAKYEYLAELQNKNLTLFYRLVTEHVEEMVPLIYTPTVGDACINYSALYQGGRGLYLAYPLRDKMDEMLDHLAKQDIDVIVVTDGERILGLGDLGVGGMGIPIGKLALYTLFGGIHPLRTMPIVLDVGTNNQELLQDPHYLGWKHERVRGGEYAAFIDAFVQGLKARLPHVLLQWEDFAKANAKTLLDRYRDKICSFNDDIQGTASVTLAAILSGLKVSGQKLCEQRFAVLGGGSAGMGICEALVLALTAHGMSKEEAYRHFYIIDIHGLIHKNMPNLDEQHKHYARDFAELKAWKVVDMQKISLVDVANNAKPTVLIGVSAQGGAFTREVIEAISKDCKHPIILPLSNPTAKAEANPQDLLTWTQGSALIATGSPFTDVEYAGKKWKISQCNNVYIFPGLGLGVIASGAWQVSEMMFLKAAETLSENSPMSQNPQAPLFPRLTALKEVTKKIALAVAKQAQAEGLAPNISDDKTLARIEKAMWFPNY